MAGNYTRDECYAPDPMFNFSPPKSGSAACPSLSGQLEREKIERLKLKNKILQLKLKRLKKKVSTEVK
jgi:hypothetical protein